MVASAPVLLDILDPSTRRRPVRGGGRGAMGEPETPGRRTVGEGGGRRDVDPGPFGEPAASGPSDATVAGPEARAASGPPVGRTPGVSGYEILGELGRGGM